MEQTHATKQGLLDAGIAMLLRHGYHDLGLQALLEQTETPKGSFYHHFRDKEDFALQVIDEYMKHVHAGLDACLGDETLPPLARVRRFPVGIVLRYEEILPLRRQRIVQLLGAAYRILGAWRAGRGLREALRECYAPEELEAVLAGILRLYAMETRALSRAVRLPALLRPAQDSIGRRLYDIMDAQGARLARDAARGVPGEDLARQGHVQRAVFRTGQAVGD